MTIHDGPPGEASDKCSVGANRALAELGLDLLGASQAQATALVPEIDENNLPDALPDQGIGAEAALRLLSGSVLAGAARLSHPGYFAHMDPPTEAVTWIAAMWQAATNQNQLHPDVGPQTRALERRLIEWLSPYFGMSGGHLVPGSTVANLTALWAAREARGIKRVAASTQSHLSVRKASDLLGLEYLPMPVDARHRLQLDRHPLPPDTALVATAGTVATGAVDAFERHGAAWLHVDAAWGGPLRLSDRYAAQLEGIASADSVGFSAHKWCFQPKGSAVLLFKDNAEAEAPLTYGGGYLAVPNVGLLGSAPASALPFVASLLAWGRGGLSARIDHTMAQGQVLSEAVASDPALELWGKPETGVVVWRSRAHAAEAIRPLLTDAWMSLTRLDGATWFRCVPANPAVSGEHVYDAVLDALKHLDRRSGQ
ncbi:MAG: pyridoxal-dependent decarboxylase [Pseudomonadota bacterium]